MSEEHQGTVVEAHEPLAKMIAPRSESFPATKDNIPPTGAFVDYPRDEDVVGTRRRTWQHHPGNVYYREVVMEYRDILMDPRDLRTLRQLSGEIIDRVVERNAVFLKADEQKGGWHVMDFSASLHKATLALKNAEIKKRSGCGSGGDGGRKKKAKVSKKSKEQQVGFGAGPVGGGTNMGAAMEHRPMAPGHKQQDLPPINYQEGEPPTTTPVARDFEAVEGSVSVDQYAKDIIALMCKQTNAKQALTALDFPLESVSLEGESDKQRLLRLQLRQRYIAALTIGMSPINFSVRLMEVWGGTVVERRVVSDGTTKTSPVHRSDDFSQDENDNENSTTQDTPKQGTSSDVESGSEEGAADRLQSSNATEGSNPEESKSEESKPEEMNVEQTKMEESQVKETKPEVTAAPLSSSIKTEETPSDTKSENPTIGQDTDSESATITATKPIKDEPLHI